MWPSAVMMRLQTIIGKVFFCDILNNQGWGNQGFQW